MTPSTRDTVLFWIKVGLGLTGMLLMFGMLTCLIFFTVAQIRTLDENRARDRAMLQQHSTEQRQHHEAMLDHRALMQRLAR